MKKKTNSHEFEQRNEHLKIKCDLFKDEICVLESSVQNMKIQKEEQNDELHRITVE